MDDLELLKDAVRGLSWGRRGGGLRWSDLCEGHSSGQSVAASSWWVSPGRRTTVGYCRGCSDLCRADLESDGWSGPLSVEEVAAFEVLES